MTQNLETTEREAAPQTPRTPLGRRLSEIRARILDSGEPLLGWDEIERELALRRGGPESGG